MLPAALAVCFLGKVKQVPEINVCRGCEKGSIVHNMLHIQDFDENFEKYLAALPKKEGDDWWHDLTLSPMGGLKPPVRFKRFTRVIEKYLAEDENRDLNKLDSRGETALHAAVYNCNGRNHDAVLALLACGADINVLNIEGRTPPTSVEIKKHHPSKGYIQFHIRTLIAFGMYVRDLNMQWYYNSLAHDDVCIGPLDHAYIEQFQSYIISTIIPRTIESCSKYLEKMKKVKINECTTLYQVFRAGPEQLAYSPVKLHELEKIVKAKDFLAEFGYLFELGGLLKVVYRRACLRRKLLPDVEKALQILFKVDFPNPCCEAVIKNLNDFELVDVIEAVNFKKD